MIFKYYVHYYNLIYYKKILH